MNVSPMAVELTTTGTGSTARIQVLNVNPQPLPFEARIFRIDIDEKGQIKEVPADADFLVFPPQALVQPNQRQMVRVQWLGGQLPSSRGYYVAIDQIPVPIDPANVNKTKHVVDVQIVYHMNVLATVAPPGSTPHLTVESVRPVVITPHAKPGEIVPNAGPQPGVAVTIRNSGKRYAMLAGATWTISGKGIDNKPLKVVLDRNQLGNILGVGYLPAINGRRTFEVPTGKVFSAAPISLTFSD